MAQAVSDKPRKTTLPRPARNGAVSRRMTFEEFLQRDYEFPHEWVNGKAVEMPMVTAEHSRICGLLLMMLQFFVRKKHLGTIHFDPFVMKLGVTGSGRAPDIMFIAARHSGRLRDNFLDGPADLAVEVISPGSRQTDQAKKFAEYQTAGVGEYWLIDPKARSVTFYQLDDQGAYQAVAPDADGVYQSREVRGFKVRPDWLWQDHLDPVECLNLSL